MIVAGSIAAGGSVASGILGSNAAKDAASTQASAAEKVAGIQGTLGQESLQNEANQFEQGQANDEPWLQSGANSLSSLDYLLGVGGPTVGSNSSTPGQTLSIPGVAGSVTLPGVKGLEGTANTSLGAYGSLMASYPGGDFKAPTADEARQTPGYQFALDQGEGAMRAGANANGSLLTGGTATALDRYAQSVADTNYNNVYNQALQNHNTNYNQWANQQTNEYNRLAGQSGVGQQTAQQLTAAGLDSAGQVAQTLSSTGQQVGQQMNNAAAATASGYVGSANALGAGITGATSNLSQYLMLSEMPWLFGKKPGSGDGSGDPNSDTIPYGGITV